MSKFKNVNVNGGNNQYGDNNEQNNITNHHHHHNNNQVSNGDDAIPLVMGAIIGFAALIWWFFNHIDEVYYYLNILTLSSAALAGAAFLLLMIGRTVEKEDIFRLMSSLFIAIGLFGLAMISREHAPNELVRLSQHTKFIDFWNSLTNYGKDLVISNLISAIGIALSALVAHLASIRQFSYSLASPNGRGFWFGLYTTIHMFRMRVSFGIITLLCGLVWTALTGHLLNIHN